MNQILYSKKANKKPIIIILALVLVLITIIVCFGFGIINKFNHKILKGVIAANVDVSNMTKEEAVEAINKIYSQSSSEKRLSLLYEDTEIKISTKDIGYSYSDAEKLAEEAYNYGRDGNILQNNFTVLNSYFNNEKVIKTEEKIDKEKLENLVKSLISGDAIFSKDDTYKVSGDKLIITKGTEGRKVDYDELSDRILTALVNRDISVEIPVNVSEPETIDMDKMYSKIHKNAVNASYKEGKDFEIIADENGIDFDLEEAKKKYASLKAGESAEVNLIITEPQIRVSDLGDALFKSVIATYSSKYDATETDRVTNLQIAANKCNNTIVYPGEEFSYNKALGHRTAENGYKTSNSFAGGKVVPSIGGGICQVSSTLYNAVLRADLTVTDRTAHEMYVKYVPQSTDATVVDNSIDFKFKNEGKYPVKIATTCENGICTASIYGYKASDAPTIDIDVKILETKSFAKQTQEDSTLDSGKTQVVQNGVDGYISEAYKVYYQNGKEISRKLISKDTYAPIDEIIKVGTKTTPTVTQKPAKTTQPTKTSTPTTSETVSNHKYRTSSQWASDTSYHWHPCAYPGCKMSHTSGRIAHSYSNWKGNGDIYHIRTCQCGRTEQAVHNFGGWQKATDYSEKRVCFDCYYQQVKTYPRNPNLPEGWDSPENPYANQNSSKK